MVAAQEPFVLVVAAQIIALGGVIGALAIVYKYLGGRQIVGWFTKKRDILRNVERAEANERFVQRIRDVVAEEHAESRSDLRQLTSDVVQLADRLADHLIEEQNLVGGLRLDFREFLIRYDADQAEVWAGLGALGYERHPS